VFALLRSPLIIGILFDYDLLASVEVDECCMVGVNWHGWMMMFWLSLLNRYCVVGVFHDNCFYLRIVAYGAVQVNRSCPHAEGVELWNCEQPEVQETVRFLIGRML
jgi:hypothetical protein